MPDPHLFPLPPPPSSQVKDGQLLVDLFVNYDCDLESSNLFERLVATLVRVAQQQPSCPPPPPLQLDTSNTHHLEQALRQEALQALVNLVQAMLTWHRREGGVLTWHRLRGGIVYRSSASLEWRAKVLRPSPCFVWSVLLPLGPWAFTFTQPAEPPPTPPVAPPRSHSGRLPDSSRRMP